VTEDVAALARDAEALHVELAAHRPRRAGTPAVAFAQAGRYEIAFATAAAVRLWLHNRDHADPRSPLWARACWLAATVRHLRERLGGQRLPATAFEDLAEAAGHHRGPVSLLTGLHDGCGL
jgi:hypothetical protein